ncbi:polyhomeotic-proximal chromatin protein-like [Rhipicephalus microplus]|uniref:polyhomeotic-proximal chromatin protein-like n=1 Tax=Rhipicephalus microplus TaxID=6941 RepID=UPI003F6B88B9
MPVPNRRQRRHVKGQKARSRAASTASCGTPRGTPPYSGQRPQRLETRSDITEDPLHEACRALVLSDLSRLLPTPTVSKPGVITHVIDGYVIQESLQPLSTATAATTSSVEEAQRYYHVSSADAPLSTKLGPGTDPGTSGAVAQDSTTKREHPQSLDTSFIETPGTAESLPRAATSTAKLRRRKKIPSLVCKKTEKGLKTTPRKTVSSVPGVDATSKSELINGTPPEVQPMSPQGSVALQASPPLITEPRQRQHEPAYPLQNWSNSPENWTVDEVAEYVSGIPGCERIAEKFRHHEIDGGALFLIKEHHLIRTMDMKLGPALKICATIGSLREVLS